jgi:dipeptidase E
MEKRKQKQIIAMGGGGFTMEPGNPLLDEYVLSQSPSENPRICFLPTASGDNEEYIRMYYDYFRTQRCIPSHLALGEPQTPHLENFLLEQDIIYVGGGHTTRMLTLWKIYGLDVILKKAWEQGILLAGVSSGCACWFEEAVTDSVPDTLSPEKCLGFLKGSSCSHFDNPERRPTFHQLIRTCRIPDGIGVDNFAALHFLDDQIDKIVTSRPGPSAYMVKKKGERTVEQKLNPVFLGE